MYNILHVFYNIVILEVDSANIIFNICIFKSFYCILQFNHVKI